MFDAWKTVVGRFQFLDTRRLGFDQVSHARNTYHILWLAMFVMMARGRDRESLLQRLRGLTRTRNNQAYALDTMRSTCEHDIINILFCFTQAHDFIGLRSFIIHEPLREWPHLCFPCFLPTSARSRRRNCSALICYTAGKQCVHDASAAKRGHDASSSIVPWPRSPHAHVR